MGKYRQQYLELREDFWDPLEPETKNKILGCYHAAEGGMYIAITTAAVTWPVPSLRQIAVTALIAGFISARNYLKQPSRVPYISQTQSKGE